MQNNPAYAKTLENKHSDLPSESGGCTHVMQFDVVRCNVKYVCMMQCGVWHWQCDEV